MKTDHVNLIKVGVLMGGPSAEHEVSLATGKNVIQYLDKTKYLPIAIKISKKGQWMVDGKAADQKKILKYCDVFFNALHGAFGEDGTIQAFLSYAGVKYTGSGIAASALAMDKLRSREIFKMAGFNVPKTLKLRRGEDYQARLNLFVNKVTKLPVVVKPCSSGSSVGITIVNRMDDLVPAVEGAFGVDRKVLVEEFIRGIEVTCGVLENYNGQEVGALPVTEIRPAPHYDFFNYQAKYKNGGAEEITPAAIDNLLRDKIQETAVRAHNVLGCSGYSRTDMIIKSGSGSLYVLETNTLPGLTNNSLLPKAAKTAGISFPELLDKIIQNSLL